MMSKKFLKIILLLLIPFLAGILFQKYVGIWWVKENILGISSYSQTRNEVQIEEIDESKLMVALTFGQSNSANFSDQLNTSRNHVYNFYQGKLYMAKDPMLGADGRGGSVWPLLGDTLIDNKLFSVVIFVTIGVSGAEISRWSPNGDLYPKLVETIKSLHSKGFKITHLLWHQGETDALLDTSQGDYVRHFMAMRKGIRSLDVNEAPFYVSIASHVRNETEDKNIRSAQKQLIYTFPDVFPGPDTDLLGNEYRYDGTHFSGQGMKMMAQLWFQAIEKNK